MDLKPADIVLALMQFLEILLPGALLSFRLRNFAFHHLLGTNSVLPKPEGEAQNWVVFFFASYLLGHFVFLIASFLDSFAYDPARRLWKPISADQAYQTAKAIKSQHLREKDQEVVNTFQWVKAKMNLEFPASLSELKRYESDSKFFRSLAIVFLALAAGQVWRGEWLSVLGCVIFSLFSFWRYFDQRWKSTQIAYTYLIAMEDLDTTTGAARPNSGRGN
jgi:hypothetical protein